MTDSDGANPDSLRRTRLLPRVRLLAGMRIRRKLIVLHTLFSLALAGILAFALGPAIAEVVRQAEAHEAGLVLRQVLAERAGGGAARLVPSAVDDSAEARVSIRYGGPEAVGIDSASADQARTLGHAITYTPSVGPPVAAAYEPATGQFISASVTLASARRAVVRLYLVMTIALLAVYALVAAALEIFVLPHHVYRPIRALLEADRAVQEGRSRDELVPLAAMPRDELGEIMRSRNESILSLRRHERELAAALSRLEEVATDLRRKNHLLEMAQRNLADADRLAGLGMMSAGIAHELNTPLAVLKGLVERVAGASGSADALTEGEAALMLRVVGRLERLSESLLDYARVRPPKTAPTLLRPLVEEAWTLVRLDRAREAGRAEIEIDVPGTLGASCDGARIVQVLVNLLRNAVDAMDARAGGNTEAAAVPTIRVAGGSIDRNGSRWATLTITDSGPGIDPEVLARLFQPFVSTRLDAKGTGLGLAVAEGIVREHGGVILGRNRREAPGAIFEIILPEAVSAGNAGLSNR